VTRFATLAGLALRELWISFRLLALLAAFLLAVLPVALVPYVAPQLAATPFERLGWYAEALAIAVALSAAIAAFTLSGELRRGTFAWLAFRVPRSGLLLAWFMAFAGLLALGLAVSASVAGISLGVAIGSEGAGLFAAASGGVAAAGMAALGLALLTATFLRPLVAAAVAGLLVGGALLAGALGPLGWAPLPTAGLALLARTTIAARPYADALSSSGIALLVAAAALLLAAARLERTDL
jgi:hypothetical protein